MVPTSLAVLRPSQSDTDGKLGTAGKASRFEFVHRRPLLSPLLKVGVRSLTEAGERPDLSRRKQRRSEAKDAKRRRFQGRDSIFLSWRGPGATADGAETGERSGATMEKQGAAQADGSPRSGEGAASGAESPRVRWRGREASPRLMRDQSLCESVTSVPPEQSRTQRWW